MYYLSSPNFLAPLANQANSLALQYGAAIFRALQVLPFPQTLISCVSIVHILALLFLDRLHISLFKTATDKYRNGQEKANIPLKDYFGIVSGFPLAKEDHVMAIVCQQDVILLAFQNRETQIAWELTVRKHLGEGQSVQNFILDFECVTFGS